VRLVHYVRRQAYSTAQAFDIDDVDQSVAPENRVVRFLGFEDTDALPQPKAIRWFHATRVPFGTEFGEGLLPTTEALPKLWEALGQIAGRWSSQEEWREYQKSFKVSSTIFPVIRISTAGVFRFLDNVSSRSPGYELFSSDRSGHCREPHLAIEHTVEPATRLPCGEAICRPAGRVRAAACRAEAPWREGGWVPAGRPTDRLAALGVAHRLDGLPTCAEGRAEALRYPRPLAMKPCQRSRVRNLCKPN
jgi:hypothetical protein